MGNETEYGYDPVSNLATLQRPNGFTLGYTYDNVNRPTARQYPGGSSVSWSYDVVNRKVTMADATGSTVWEFDNRGLLSKRTTPGNRITEYLHDNGGRRKEIKDSQGAITEYGYNYAQGGRLSTIGFKNGAEMVSYTYYDNGLVDERRHGNGTVVKHEYDDANRLKKITHWPGSVGQGTPLESFAYLYDPHGNRTRLTFADASYIQYYYNSIDELEVEVWREADGSEYRRIEYFYDPNGNRTRRVLTEYPGGNPVVTTTDYEHNAGNQVTEATTGNETVTYQHDANGNLTEKHGANGTTAYTWDYDDRLTGITFPGSSTNSFTYNGQHRRVEKEDSEGTKQYEWDGLDVLLERDGSGNFQMRYTQGLTPVAGIGANVAKRDASGDDTWFHQDSVGSTRLLTDSTPTTVRTYQYDAFGNVVGTSGTDGTGYRFTGKESDADNGLIYFGARYYDPVLGRFLSLDPVRGQLNGYRYAANNPVGRVDPDGRKDLGIHGGYRWVFNEDPGHPLIKAFDVEHKRPPLVFPVFPVVVIMLDESNPLWVRLMQAGLELDRIRSGLKGAFGVGGLEELLDSLVGLGEFGYRTGLRGIFVDLYRRFTGQEDPVLRLFGRLREAIYQECDVLLQPYIQMVGNEPVAQGSRIAGHVGFFVATLFVGLGEAKAAAAATRLERGAQVVDDLQQALMKAERMARGGQGPWAGISVIYRCGKGELKGVMEYVGEAMETGILPGHGNVTEKYGAAIMMEGHHRYLASLITDKPFLIMRSTDPWGAPLHWTRLHWWEKVCFWWEVVVVK